MTFAKTVTRTLEIYNAQSRLVKSLVLAAKEANKEANNQWNVFALEQHAVKTITY